MADALDGYRDLIGYWERTGGWVQQWTTLRNLAALLRSLGDADTATFLEAAADAAPDAPATTFAKGGDEHARSEDGRATPVRVEAHRATRAKVLEVARAALDRHKALPQPGGQPEGLPLATP